MKLNKFITVNEALKILNKAKKQLGGDLALILSLTDSGIPDATVNDLVIRTDADNRYIEVQVKHHNLAVPRKT